MKGSNLIRSFIFFPIFLSVFIAVSAQNGSLRPVFPLSVSENGRYFVDQNKVPFFILADTPWSLFVALTDDGAEKLS